MGSGFSSIASTCWRKDDEHAMTASRRADIRLFVDHDLAAGASAPLEPEQLHYLLHVMRMKPGDMLLVFNGRDGEWRAALSMRSKREAGILCEEQLRPQPPSSGPWLLFAPLKSARLDYMMQKAVEMGVSRAIPVMTERTQAQRFNAGRARANMIEAAEQCGILSVPDLAPDLPLEACLSSWPKERRLIFCDEATEIANPADVLAALPRDEPYALLIGPEGGFSDSERRLVGGLAKATTLSLGPRILRADTAAVAALVLYQAVLGDWRT
jgi:16S rRNA (uracil1498-N3)-methyltransferase